MLDQEFFESVFGVVKAIPKGKVLTYGRIAQLIGRPRASRQVGYVLHRSPGIAGGVPCHRVVFANGELAPHFAFGGDQAQRRLLESEGVSFTPKGRVNLKEHLWNPSAEL